MWAHALQGALQCNGWDSKSSSGFMRLPLSEAGHRAKADAFQRLIKALPNASLYRFNDY